jgi:hypoxanthine-DNA glycosylase
MKIRNKGFAPVVDACIKVLLLGSFPSAASLDKCQYYAYSKNQFWRLVGAVIEEPLSDMDYQQRLQTLLKHHIGLWDVIDVCRRRGSLDSNIRYSIPNDFARVIRVTKKLQRVCFNGKTAGRFEPVFAEWGYKTLVLPSSSPAHATLSFGEKLKAWRKIL